MDSKFDRQMRRASVSPLDDSSTFINVSRLSLLFFCCAMRPRLSAISEYQVLKKRLFVFSTHEEALKVALIKVRVTQLEGLSDMNTGFLGEGMFLTPTAESSRWKENLILVPDFSRFNQLT